MMSRRLFHFALFPKFKDEHTMPFTKGQPEDLSNLRDMAYGWGKLFPVVPLETKGRDSTSTSIPSNPWPSILAKPSSKGPSRRL